LGDTELMETGSMLTVTEMQLPMGNGTVRVLGTDKENSKQKLVLRLRQLKAVSTLLQQVLEYVQYQKV